MRRSTRASVTASKTENIDKENRIPFLERNLNADAAVKNQLKNGVDGGRTGKLALRETSNDAIEIKSNENAVVKDYPAVGAVKGNEKYIVNGQPVVRRVPKINRRSKEQNAVLNNISNNLLAPARDKDVKNEVGQLNAVRLKGQRREVNKFRQPKVHSHKKRKCAPVQRSSSQSQKVVVESSCEEEEEDCTKEEEEINEEVIVISDEDQILPESERILADRDQLIVSDQLRLKSHESKTVLHDPFKKIAGTDSIFPNHENVSDHEPIDSESDDDDEDDFAPTPRYLHDIDYEDDDDPSFLNEYVLDVYDYMRTLERENFLDRDFLSKQSEVTDRMRSVLVDWLVLANYEYKMTQETLFLTVAIVDRYLQKVNTPKNELQLVGVAAMWVASKYEEITTVEVAELVHLTDNSYTAGQVRRMECNILKVLDFQLSVPLQIQFLRRFTKAAGADPFLHAVAKYLMELALVPYNLAHYPASKVAAAAICLSNALIVPTSNYRQFWNGTMVFHSKYEVEDLAEVIKELAVEALNMGQSRFSSVTKKFATSKLMRASVFVQNRLKVLQQIINESSQ